MMDGSRGEKRGYNDDDQEQDDDANNNINNNMSQSKKPKIPGLARCVIVFASFCLRSVFFNGITVGWLSDHQLFV